MDHGASFEKLNLDKEFECCDTLLRSSVFSFGALYIQCVT